MKTPFMHIACGDRFKTPHSKRDVTCVKVAPTYAKGSTRNAVILLDHTGHPAKDLGVLISVRDEEIVETSK